MKLEVTIGIADHEIYCTGNPFSLDNPDVLSQQDALQHKLASIERMNDRRDVFIVYIWEITIILQWSGLACNPAKN